jgi:MFS family permease
VVGRELRPSLGVLLVVGGRMGDKYGKRRMFLVAISGFSLLSIEVVAIIRRPF